MNTQHTVLLFSGGLDSIAAWYALGKPYTLYCGGLHGPAREASLGELNAIKVMKELSRKFDNMFTGVNINFTPFMRKDRWVFPREQLLCQLAWAHGCNKVLVGWVKNDNTTVESLLESGKNMENAVALDDFKVEFPVASMSKAEIVMKALGEGAPPEVLLSSHSCVKRSDIHCGDCVNCCERYIAFKVAQVSELPQTYLALPQKSGAMEILVERNKDKKWFEIEAKTALGKGVYNAICLRCA